MKLIESTRNMKFRPKHVQSSPSATDLPKIYQKERPQPAVSTLQGNMNSFVSKQFRGDIPASWQFYRTIYSGNSKRRCVLPDCPVSHLSLEQTLLFYVTPPLSRLIRPVLS
jgi:hypothetical protein